MAARADAVGDRHSERYEIGDGHPAEREIQKAAPNAPEENRPLRLYAGTGRAGLPATATPGRTELITTAPLAI